VHIVWFAIGCRRAGRGCFVAGSSVVDEVLDDGSIGHGDCGKEEAPGDTSDGFEEDSDLAEKRIEAHVKDGNKDDDGDGVDVLHDIVGDAV